MDDPIRPDIARALLAFLEWHVHAIRLHLDHLQERCRAVLIEPAVPAPPQDAYFARQLSETIHALSVRAIPLLQQLGVCADECEPAIRDRVAALSVEYDALAAEWRGLLEAVDHLAVGGHPPQ